MSSAKSRYVIYVIQVLIHVVSIYSSSRINSDYSSLPTLPGADIVSKELRTCQTSHGCEVVSLHSDSQSSRLSNSINTTNGIGPDHKRLLDELHVRVKKLQEEEVEQHASTNLPRGSPSWASGSIMSAINDISSSSSFPTDEDSTQRGSTGISRSEMTQTGRHAYYFLSSLASSPAFLSTYWHRRPLLIRSSDTAIIDARHTNHPAEHNQIDERKLSELVQPSFHPTSWIAGLFTVNNDLKLIDNSYITGHKTAEILRNGTKTDTWAFLPLKEDAKRLTKWKDVTDALAGGTVYFNTAGSLWPKLGALCRLVNASFGIPSNVNIYVTPPGCTLSVPPHTDRQDVMVFQTAGRKRWRVYAPPKRKKRVDPLNRGKGGDELSVTELEHDSGPLLDVVLREGDFLYVPVGFPHTTDTANVLDDLSTSIGDSRKLDDSSVHLTMGLDTHVWGLTYAHLRWVVLQRCGKSFDISIDRDDTYWKAVEALPIGFLGGIHWKACLNKLRIEGRVDRVMLDLVRETLKNVLLDLEPHRWSIAEDKENADEKEPFPADKKIDEATEYMFMHHLLPLLTIQDEMFSKIYPKREETIVKAFQCSQKQTKLMEALGEFSMNEAMRASFAQRRQYGERAAAAL